MSVNLAGITFPNYVTGIKDSDSEWFKGGYDFQSRNPVNNLYTKVTLIKDIESFVVGEHLITPTAPYVIETEIVKVFMFPNNYYFGVRAKMKPSGSYNTVEIYGDLYDKSDIKVPNTDISSFSQLSYAQNISADVSILGLKIDIILTTKYYPTVDPPTGANSLSLAFEYIAGFPDSGYILSSGINYLNDLAGLLPGIPFGDLLRWDDLTPFNSYMKSHGDPFDGDVFNTDPMPDEPAGSDDTSEPGGGGGNYDNTSDPIDFPALPQGGALESGSIIAHRVVKQTLEAIFSKLWTKSIFDLDAMWQKSIQNPMDAIVSLHALPCSPTVEADSNNIYIGNLDMEVTSPKLTSQYIEVDCGTVTLNEFWGSALDYSPYTRVEIYLPFIGVQTLRTEDVMKTAVHVKYHVDALTGDCIAFIKCGLSVLYTFNGNCKMSIPLSARSTDFLQKVAAAAGLAIGAVGVSVGGGAALAGATKPAQIAAAQKTATAADIQAYSMGVSSAANVASTKINTSRSGDISGGLSLMASFVPYFIIHRPVQSLAKDFNKFKGYTSNITKRLGDLTGFTEVEHVNLQGIPNATAAEMAEIKTALKNGVIF